MQLQFVNYEDYDRVYPRSRIKYIPPVRSTDPSNIIYDCMLMLENY